MTDRRTLRDPARPKLKPEEKANYIGRPESEMAAAAAIVRDETLMLSSCLFCRWTFRGSTGEGRSEALAHRRAKHPEAVGRKTYRKPNSFKMRMPVADDVIKESRRVRVEREDADRLATIMRGRLRRGEATS